MTYEHILFNVEERVATITLNRPQVLNAINLATQQELLVALQAAEADAAIQIVVLTGAGERAFAAGADIRELQALRGANEARIFAERGHEISRFISQMHAIVIASINGLALGGGCELAMACDIRLAADTARLGQPEINLGLIPGWGGTQRLTRLVGAGMSKLLCLSGEPISAAEAQRIGLLERVVPAAELSAVTTALARRIASQPPLAAAAIKQAINRGAEMPLNDANAYEAALFGTIASSNDAQEGTSAFLEKRQASWSGS